MIRRLLDIVTYPLRALLSSPMRFFAAGQRLLGLSLPARVAILSAVFLVICVITAFAAFYWTEDRIAWNYWVNPVRVLVITLLLFAIPWLVYRVLKLWLEGDVSRYPDIDVAWQAGLAALERQRLELRQVPLFLVLGSSGEEQERALFEAAHLRLSIRGIPEGAAALHWYANPEGIYLVCTAVGCLSRLAAAGGETESMAAVAARPSPPRPAVDSLRGTIVVAGEPVATEGLAATAAPRSAATSVSAGDIRGTMVVRGFGEDEGQQPVAEKKVIGLQPDERTEEQRRLEYLGRLVRRARQPFCPVNSLLTLLPLGLIQRPKEAIEVQRAVRRDLDTLQATLRLRCPVTALVTGMETEDGFRELVRRVGRERAVAQRFGKGFSLWNPPTPERLEALALHACGAFEDWVYTLFREKGALSKPGNTRLYALLCRIRRDVQRRLAHILAAGFAAEPGERTAQQGFLFSGCYFAATGAAEDRQAFVKAVFEKLPAEQEELQWTVEALADDDRFHRLGRLVLLGDALLSLTLLGMVLYKWFPFWR